MLVDEKYFLIKNSVLSFGIWAVLMIVLCPSFVISQIPGSNPSKDFIKHSIIYPKTFHGREKRQISTTKQDGNHVENLVMDYEVDGVNYVLELFLNKELVPKNSFIAYQDQGRDVVTTLTNENIDLCQYKGKMRGVKDSWAAISTCNGLNGVVFTGSTTHYLQSGKDMSLNAPHYLYKNDDLISNSTCGHNDEEDRKFDENHRQKRSNNNFVMKGPHNSNKNSLYVEYVLVIDNENYVKSGRDRDKINTKCRDIVNIMNGIYAPLNIFIALSGVIIWTEYDEIRISRNSDDVLNGFLRYRREKLINNFPNDNAQLLTGVRFNGDVIGKAIKGPICTFESSGGVIVDHSDVIGSVATTAAHELGHNFGMEHDDDKCQCPDTKCVMSAVNTGLVPTFWSTCSLNYLTFTIEQGMDNCLRNKPESLFLPPICGNGFVEDGEECDCGLPNNCVENLCCNPYTCKLRANATCATGECCDKNTCKLLPAGTTCRDAIYECDLPEFCTENSEYCPNDVYKIDTTPCDGGNSFCYRGACRSRSDQCQILWGPSGSNSEKECYNLNIVKPSNRYGNCGYNFMTKEYTHCEEENKLCGLLHCHHLNERLEFGLEAYSIPSYSFVNTGIRLASCRTAIVDLGTIQAQVGYVPNGAKCGEGKMCLDRKCLSINYILENNELKNRCPLNCSGNGICNSMGNCHCNDGFAPPLCVTSGSGGSVDSGSPLSNNMKTILLIVCLTIVVAGSVLICIIIYKFCQSNGMNWRKKPSSISYVKNITSACCLNSWPVFTCGVGDLCSSSFSGNHISSDNNTSNNKTNNVYNSECDKSEVFVRNGNNKLQTDKPTIEKGSLISTTNEHVQNNFAFYKSRVLSLRRSSIFAKKDDKQFKNMPKVSNNVSITKTIYHKVTSDSSSPSTSYNLKYVSPNHKNILT